MEKKPMKAMIDGIGWITATKEEPIKFIQVAGEMSNVFWLQQGNKDYNGKYVVTIEYF